MKKSLIFCFIVILGALATYAFFPKKTDSFSVANITPKPRSIHWELKPLSSEEKNAIHQVLGQKFSYFGAGAQSYVFFSQDGQYVLKLIKQKRYNAPSWVRFFPLERYRNKKNASKIKNLVGDFNSYAIAFNKLQRETALLFVHLNCGDDFKENVTIVDPLNNEHKLDLNSFEFILQKKGELVYSTIESLVKKGDMNGAKAALTSLLNLLDKRRAKGIQDKDPNFSKNYAFIHGEAVEIDIGRFTEEEVVKLPTIRQEFKDWLQSKSPELLEHWENHYRVLTQKNQSFVSN